MRRGLEARLSSYWRLEALNVVIVPGVAALVVISADDRLSAPLILAMVAVSALLVVGALAWRMELAGLRRERDFAPAVLPWLALAQTPALALALLSMIGAVYERVGDGAWTPSSIATAALATLAVLEYVNYYMVQLQHFDHAADFARLLKGRGFRRAHLAKALSSYRSQR